MTALAPVRSGVPGLPDRADAADRPSADPRLDVLADRRRMATGFHVAAVLAVHARRCPSPAVAAVLELRARRIRQAAERIRLRLDLAAAEETRPSPPA